MLSTDFPCLHSACWQTLVVISDTGKELNIDAILELYQYSDTGNALMAETRAVSEVRDKSLNSHLRRGRQHKMHFMFYVMFSTVQ